MNKEKNGFRFPVMGVSSLLIIFSVLCLTVFAILSVSTASAGSRLSEKAAQSVTDYYAADSQAEKTISALRSGEIPEGVSTDGNMYSFTCPASDTLELQVKVRISGSDYEVLQWQMVSTADWQNDESLNLWDGN
ncbi:MAG: hypothetical protein IKM19_01735 [Firmicutes bacterium]|nr:hypothetical protein [Bacillota bacterium]